MDYLVNALNFLPFTVEPNGPCLQGRVICTESVCLLCQRIIASPEQKRLHEAEDSHIAKLSELRRHLGETKKFLTRAHELCGRRNKNTTIPRRIEALGSVQWRNNVKAAFFSYLIPSPGSASEQSSWANGWHILMQYEYLEQFALLHLAVWKAQCLQQMPSGADSILAEQWRTCDWQTVKLEQRESNAMTIIGLAVKSFLVPLRHWTSR